MNLTDIVGSKTLAYKDAFKSESSGSGLILGNRPRKKAGCQEHVSLLSDSQKSRQTDKEGNLFLHYFLLLTISETYGMSSKEVEMTASFPRKCATKEFHDLVMMPFRIIVPGIISVGLAAALILPAMADTAQPTPVDVTLRLKRGDFIVHRYVPGDAKFAQHPLAVIIFGSGDGGFGGWEERICGDLQSTGYEMLGFDCALYAKTDYDLDTLQADFNTIAQSSLARYGNQPPPLILGGWSMGAEQVVPAAGGPHPPTGLAGLLLLSPGESGRYGFRLTDGLNLSPTGAGTFALQDFAHSLDNVRVAQWDGTIDLPGSKKWLSSLTAPHKAYEFAYSTHYYNGFSDDFLKLLRESIAWVLSPPPKAPAVPLD